ncbi:MAG TPA: hypothetical protein V6C76_07340 [Drouetiella sp.]
MSNEIEVKDGNQELGSLFAFSVIILMSAFGLVYGLQHGLLNSLTDRHSYVASHAEEHMY